MDAIGIAKRENAVIKDCRGWGRTTMRRIIMITLGAGGFKYA
jgi:hypothetical protein